MSGTWNCLAPPDHPGLPGGAAATRAPDKPFLVAPDGTLSYAQAVALSQRAASGFRRLGVRAGDRVAAMLPNSAAFVLAWFGLARLGTVLLPINTAYTQAEVRSLLEHAEPRLALASARFFEVLRPAWSGPLASLEPGVGAEASWAELLAEPPLLDPPAASEEDVAVLLYTLHRARSAPSAAPHGGGALRRAAHGGLRHERMYVRHPHPARGAVPPGQHGPAAPPPRPDH